MALLQVNRDAYVRREFVYVDSTQRLNTSKDEFDVNIELTNGAVRDVQAVEVVDYNIPRSIAPTFVEETATSAGNNIIDVLMVRVSTSASLQFVVTIPPNSTYTSATTLATDLTALINTAMDAQGDPFFNTANLVQWTVTALLYEPTVSPTAGTFSAVITENTVEGTIYGYWLFRTGPNARNNPGRVLGFDPTQDTTINPFSTVLNSVYAPRGIRFADLRPFHYVDVFVDQAEAGLGARLPVARIFLTDEDDAWRRTDTLPTGARLLAPPIRYAEQIRVYLLLQGGVKPVTTAKHGWDLTLELSLVSQEGSVPSWMEGQIQALT